VVSFADYREWARRLGVVAVAPWWKVRPENGN
jgi:hypothetical protein